MGFRAANRFRVDEVRPLVLFFYAAFTSHYEESDRGDRGQTTTAKKLD